MFRKINVSKVQVLNISMLIVSQVFLFFPWLECEIGKYSCISYVIDSYMHGQEEVFKKAFLPDYVGKLYGGMGGGLEFSAKLVYILMAAVVVLQVLMIIYTIMALNGCQWNGIMWSMIVVMAVLIIFYPMQEASAVENLTTTWGMPAYFQIYFWFVIIITVGWLLAVKMLEEWDEASKRTKEERLKKKEYRRERKRRLAFPGKYSKLYYHVLWKDLLHRKKDFLILVLAEILCACFLFVGVGIYIMFSSDYGEDLGMLGLGLIELVVNFVVVLCLLSLFLLVVIFSFYRKKRIVNIGLYKTLGVRSNILNASWLGEILLSMLLACGMAFLIGEVFLAGLRSVLEQNFPELAEMGQMNGSVLIEIFVGVMAVFLIAFLLSGAALSGKQETDGRNSAVCSEKLPGRLRYAAVLMAALVIFIGFKYLSGRNMGERIIIFAVLFMSMAVLLYNGWSILMEWQKKHLDNYLRKLPQTHMISHRYKITSMYISLLAMIHICVLMLFGMKMITNRIATQPEQQFPYDYVCLGNIEDDETFERISNEYNAEVYTFPMLRIATVDGTERVVDEDFRYPLTPQGRHIGVSESTYYELKKLVGEDVEKELNLDKEGNKIHVVYQQDQAAKARPVDWYIFTNEPFIHIGNPVVNCKFSLRKEVYPPRTIVGEETGSLIGSLRQGRYEDIIVFSDDYVKQEINSWKETNIITGLKLTKEEKGNAELIEEFPTRLHLIRVREDSRNEVEKVLNAFSAKYEDEIKYDPLVKRMYNGRELCKQRKTEHRAELFLNGFIELMFLIISLFLLHMKVKIELPEMRERYLFMERLGMCEKERVQSEKREISRFVYLPLAVAMPMVIILTGIILRLRIFDGKDILEYGKYLLLLSFSYVGIQFLNMKWLQYITVKQLENKNEGK